MWYGGPRRRVSVTFTSGLRREVREIIHEIRQQLLTVSLPEAPNDRRCTECQLQQHCLPELTSALQKVSRYMADVVFRYVSTVYVRDHRARVQPAGASQRLGLSASGTDGRPIPWPTHGGEKVGLYLIRARGQV